MVSASTNEMRVLEGISWGREEFPEGEITPKDPPATALISQATRSSAKARAHWGLHEVGEHNRGLNGGPQKTHPHLHPQTCEGNLIWKKRLCRCK